MKNVCIKYEIVIMFFPPKQYPSKNSSGFSCRNSALHVEAEENYSKTRL